MLGVNAAMDVIGKLKGAVEGLAGNFQSFETAMVQVNTMAGKDAEGLAGLTDQVNALSKEIPKAREELADGLYQTISNGVPEADWLTFLEQSAKASVGGIADLGETVKVTSTVIKNYGMEWSKAGSIQDKIQMTAKNGVTSFGELAAALPRVTANAATLGVSVDELLASFATLTGVSGDTAEVSTQLSAILSALVKPSSEAAKMAEAMGIQFDAAAIKAAGGLQQFLEKLDASVKQYAKASGVLEQEVYGTLFGSAESLRALIPLTGELKDRFVENVGQMGSAAGTIDETFAQMASTGASTMQMLKNSVLSMLDPLGSLASGMLPVVEGLATAGQAALGIHGLARSIAALRNAHVLASAAAAAHKAAIGLLGKTAAATGMSVTALKAAVRGLMVATGVGAAIAALAWAMERLAGASTSAAGALDNAQGEAERFAQAQREVAAAGTDARAKLEQQIASLNGLIEAKRTGKDVSKEEKKIVAELNNTYGETMGYFASVESWYKALIANSEAYCRQMVLEAETRRLANQIAEKEEKRRNIVYDEKGEKRQYSTQRERKTRQRKSSGSKLTGGGVMGALQGSGTNSVEFYELPSAHDKAQAEYNDLTEEIGVLRDVLKGKVSEANKIDFAVKGAPTMPTAPTGAGKTTTAKTGKGGTGDGNTGGGTDADKEKHLVAEAVTYKDLTNNVAYYQQELEKANVNDRETIVTLAAKKKGAEDAVRAFNDMVEAAGAPVELNSLDDYDARLSQLQKQRRSASAETIVSIDKEIAATERARQAIEDASVAELRDDDLRTYDDINRKADYYNRLLQQGDAAQRKFAAEGISRLDKLREAWERADKAATVNVDPKSVQTLREVGEAISYLQDRQQTEVGVQVTQTQAEIEGLEQKQAALQLRVDMPKMDQELDDILSLDGKEYRMKVKAIGFDGIRDKLREIDKLMANPNLGEDQLRQLENLRAGYMSMMKDAALTFDTLQNGWNGVQSIGNGIQGITSALDENKNVWEAVTGVVNGFLQIYQGISGIVSIIQMLTMANKADAVAETAKSGAIVASTVAQTAVAPAQAAAAAALVPVMIANKAAAASYMELAAAAYFAAHASIPFAGFGIGAGFAASAKAVVMGMAIPFADGGVVSGKTIALVGEYAGANRNPEVIAPLDKLRTYLEPRDVLTGAQVHFRIDGRDLVGVLSKQTKYLDRA